MAVDAGQQGLHFDSDRGRENERHHNARDPFEQIESVES